MSRRTALVLLDPAAEVRPAALELITLGRSLGRVDVVTLEAPSVEALATLGAHGVEVVHQAEVVGAARAEETRRLTAVVAAVLAAAVRRTDADVVLVPAGFAAKEAAAVAAHALGAGLVVDASDVAWQEEGLVVTKRVFAGTWETASVVATDPAVVTVRANAVVAEPAAETPRSRGPAGRGAHR